MNAPPPAPRIGLDFALIAAAAGLFALLPLSTDVYLTALVDLSKEFAAPMAAAQRTMLAFTLGFGLAHLFIGQLADRRGRRPVALAGVALYVGASVLALLAPSMVLLTGARFLQGLAAASGPILSRALVRDATRAEASGAAFAKVFVLGGLAPLSAPLIGALASSYAGWRGAVATLAVYGIMLFLALWRSLKETRPAHLHGAAGVSQRRALAHLVSHPPFLTGAALLGCGYGVLLTWISTSAFLLIGVFGLTRLEASAIYVIGAATNLAGGLASLAASRRLAPRAMLRIAAMLLCLGSLAPALLVESGDRHAVWLLLAVLPFYFGWAFGQPMAIATAMRPFPEMAGQASAWLGLLQQAGGILVSSGAAWLAPGLGTPVVMSVGALAFAGVAFWPGAKRARRRPTVP